MKITADLLELAGYTETQIDRVFKLINRKQQFGPQSLSISDRRFYLKAQGDVKVASDKLDKLVVTAQKRRVSGKQPVETKLHYRWTVAEVILCQNFAELAIGEVSAFQILREEVLRALEIYQPVLDQVDTSKRGRFDGFYTEMMELAAALGRSANFDWDGYRAALKVEFPENWNTAWDAHYSADNYPAYGVLSGDDIVQFRALVRPEIERLTREAYPSVRSTVAA
jgi:hypothetical protein